MRRILAAVAAVLLAACGGGGGATDETGGPPPAQVATAADRYLPLEANGRWYYQVDGSSQRLTAAALGPHSVDGATGLRVNVANPLALGAEVVTYVAGADAVREYPEDEGDPLLKALSGIETLRWPARAGDSHVQLDRTIDFGADLDGDGRNDRVAVLATQRVIGFESLRVPAGLFDDVLHLQQDLKLTLLPTGGLPRLTVHLVTDQWLARGVGPVRVDRVLDDSGSRTTSSLTLVAWRAGALASHNKAPALLSTQPARSPARSATLDIAALFDAPIDALTLQNGGFTLADADGRPVAGRVEAVDGAVRFVPEQPLVSGRYDARIAGATDVLGWALAAPVAWDFEVDAQAPGLLQHWPAAEALDVPVDSVVRVRFSEPVDPASVNPAYVGLSLGGLRLATTLRVEGSDVLLVPAAPLPLGQEIGLSLWGVTDLAGNPMLDSGYSADFMTVQGAFAQPAALFPGPWPDLAHIADLDGDGLGDLLTLLTEYDPGTYSMRWLLHARLRLPDGQLATATTMALPGGQGCTPTSLSLSDLDGDARSDLLVGTDGCGAMVFRRLADGGLATGAALPGSQLRAVRPVALGGGTGTSLLGIAGEAAALRLWRPAGPEAWAVVAEPAAGTGFVRAATAADLDADGRTDLVALLVDGNTLVLAVLRQRADGSFAPPERRALGIPRFDGDVAVGDVNGDGRPDIVVTAGSYQEPPGIGVLHQGGDGSFGAMALWRTTALPLRLLVADLDRDGRVDIAASLDNPGQIAVFRQQADGSAAPVTHYKGLHHILGPFGLQLGDVDADGWPDLIQGGTWLRQFPPAQPPSLAGWFRRAPAAQR